MTSIKDHLECLRLSLALTELLSALHHHLLHLHSTTAPPVTFDLRSLCF